MRSPFLVLAVIAVALLWVARFVLAEPSGANQPGVPEIPDRGGPTDREVGFTGPAVERVALPEQTGDATRFLVRDADGRLLGGVAVRCAAANARWLDEHAPQLGATDTAGELLVDGATLGRVPDGGAVVFQKAGHVTASLFDVAIGQSYEVRLPAGYRVDANVVDQLGAPVAGARLLLSPVSLPAADGSLPADVRPGADRRNAVYATATDERGVAAIAGVPPGRYSMRLGHPHYSMSGGLESFFVDVPGPSLALRMSRLYGAVIRVVGDELVTRNVSLPPGGDVARLVIAGIRTARESLRKRYPDALTYVTALRDPTRPIPPVVFSAYFARTGWKDVMQGLAPLDELEPTELRLVAGAEHCADVVFDVFDAAGRSLPRVPVALVRASTSRSQRRQTQHSEPPMRISVRTDEVVRVPAGSFELETGDPWVREAMPETTKLSFRAGEARRVRLDLAGELCPVTITLSTPDDGSFTNAYCIVRDHIGRFREMSILASKPVHLVLPPGEYTTFVRMTGYRDSESRQLVAPTGETQQWTLPVAYRSPS